MAARGGSSGGHDDDDDDGASLRRRADAPTKHIETQAHASPRRADKHTGVMVAGDEDGACVQPSGRMSREKQDNLARASLAPLPTARRASSSSSSSGGPIAR